jgi:phosphatidylglycerol lysyltransferase
MSGSQAFDQLAAAGRGPSGEVGRDGSLARRAEPSREFVPAETRYALLRQYGTFTLAYAVAFEPGLRHFGDERGFLAYKTVWGTAMVLADPIAPPDGVADLIDRFLREHADVAFWQVSYATAAILASRGFTVNEFGPDPRLDLATYSFEGQAKRNLRKATRAMDKLGYVTRECALAELDIDEVKAVSDAWKRTRTFRNTEVAFFNRPVVFENEPDVRRFFAFDRDGRIAGFGFFDPIYERGEVVGYSTSNTRYRPEIDAMIGHAIKRAAIEVFQKEGRKWLFLGLSPAEQINDEDFEPDWLVRRSLRFAYTNPLFNRFVYPLRGHATHKNQFRGEFVRTYLAFNRRPGILRLLRLFRVSKMV